MVDPAFLRPVVENYHPPVPAHLHRHDETPLLHDPGQGIFHHLDSQMDVVGHATKTMDSMSIPLHPLLNQQIEVMTIFFIEKDVLSTVSTQHHVIESAGDVKPLFSGHRAILGQRLL